MSASEWIFIAINTKMEQASGEGAECNILQALRRVGRGVLFSFSEPFFALTHRRRRTDESSLRTRHNLYSIGPK